LLATGDDKPRLVALADTAGYQLPRHIHRLCQRGGEDLLSQPHAYCINTSAKEGWGLTVIEANACGTPTVSSNVQGLRDAVVDGETGLLYEYGNREQLAEKILFIVAG